MSERSVIVSVVLALVMVGVWRLSLINTRPTDTQPVALIDFDPAAVDRIEVSVTASADVSTESTIVIERAILFGSSRWMVRYEMNGETLSWPADEGRVRAGLRVLSTATMESRSNASDMTGGTLTLTMADTSTRVVSFGADPLAGRVEVAVNDGSERTGLTDAEIFEALIRTGLLAWRDPHALLTMNAGPSQIELESPSGTLSIVRRQGRWSMLEPIQSLVRTESARELAGHLAALSLDGFEPVSHHNEPVDALANLKYGFAQPLATIVTETDFRMRDGEAVQPGTLRQRMIVGSPTDATGQQVFVYLEWSRLTGDAPPETIAGPVVGRVATEVLNKLTTRPEPYIHPVILTSLPASIDRLTISDPRAALQIRRDGVPWRTDEQLLLPDETEFIQTLLKHLTESPADAITIVDADLIDRDAAIGLRVIANDGSTPVDLYLFQSNDNLLVAAGPIARQYPESGHLFAQLRALLDRASATTEQSPTSQP